MRDCFEGNARVIDGGDEQVGQCSLETGPLPALVGCHLRQIFPFEEARAASDRSVA